MMKFEKKICFDFNVKISMRIAIEYFDKALKIRQFYINALAYKGNSLRCLGKYDEAIECFIKGLDKCPNHVECQIGCSILEELL